jgi:general secretion pathway protein K
LHDDIPAEPARAPDGGFILIPVLVTLGLLSLIAMTLAKSTMTDVRAVAHQLRSAEAEAIADGIARLAVRRIVTDRVAGRDGSSGAILPTNGRSVACRIPGATMVVTAQDAGGLIDLNTAPQGLLTLMFVSVDVGGDEAARLAAAIIDFRDADDKPVAGGAEMAEYRAAGLPFGPKNAPFASTNELDQVFGLTPEIAARVRTLITVSSSSLGIDTNTANVRLRNVSRQPEFAVPSNGRAFQLRVTAATDQGTSFTRDLVFEPNLRAQTGFVITDWRRGMTDAFDAQAGSDLSSCLDLALPG